MECGENNEIKNNEVAGTIANRCGWVGVDPKAVRRVHDGTMVRGGLYSKRTRVVNAVGVFHYFHYFPVGGFDQYALT